MFRDIKNFIINGIKAVMNLISFVGLPVLLVRFCIEGLMDNNEMSCLAFCIGVVILGSMVYTLYSLFFSYQKMCRKYNDSVRFRKTYNDNKLGQFCYRPMIIEPGNNHNKTKSIN